jgi:hypothetical protein
MRGLTAAQSVSALANKHFDINPGPLGTSVGCRKNELNLLQKGI